MYKQTWLVIWRRLECTLLLLLNIHLCHSVSFIGSLLVCSLVPFFKVRQPSCSHSHANVPGSQRSLENLLQLAGWDHKGCLETCWADELGHVVTNFHTHNLWWSPSGGNKLQSQAEPRWHLEALGPWFFNLQHGPDHLHVHWGRFNLAKLGSHESVWYASKLLMQPYEDS